RECLSVRATGVFVQNLHFICNGIGELPAISVAEGADLELDGCRIQSMTALGVALNGNATLTAIGTSFSSSNGVALRADAGKIKLTQSTITDSRVGLRAAPGPAPGAALELESCAFERNGGSDPQGAIMAVTGNVGVTLKDCHFTNNSAGILLLDEAQFGAWRGSFKNNAENTSSGATGLVAVRRGSKALFTNVSFEGNGQGLAASERGILEMDQCTFARNGSQTRQLILPMMPVSVSGRDSRATLKNTRMTDSAQFAVFAANAAALSLEDVEISSARSCAIGIGDTGSAPVRAEIRRANIHDNQTGLGVFAGSNVTVEDSQFHDNQEGIIVGERESQVELRKTEVLGNREHGLVVYGESKARAVESQFRNNGRGAQSGTPRKSNGRGSLTLEDCAVGGNRIFGVGAHAQSELVLRRVNFEGGDKTNIYKERNAIVQTEASPAPEASASPEASAETSPTPSQKPRSSATPPRRPRPSPKPKTRRPEEDAERILRHIFGPRR
ncbi:MAG: right-handed parallel beta-helix repeat-containing protein, partial [Verrucomicrobiaceae bacterium]|nr:right-handed parallel beta-helix repeat-containing protein [Verrucomicrobiaceae bacterium]